MKFFSIFWNTSKADQALVFWTKAIILSKKIFCWFFEHFFFSRERKIEYFILKEKIRKKNIFIDYLNKKAYGFACLQKKVKNLNCQFWTKKHFFLFFLVFWILFENSKRKFKKLSKFPFFLPLAWIDCSLSLDTKAQNKKQQTCPNSMEQFWHSYKISIYKTRLHSIRKEHKAFSFDFNYFLRISHFFISENNTFLSRNLFPPPQLISLLVVESKQGELQKLLKKHENSIKRFFLKKRLETDHKISSTFWGPSKDGKFRNSLQICV